MKLDQNGNYQWIKLYGGVGFNRVEKMLSEDDGGAVCLGSTNGYG